VEGFKEFLLIKNILTILLNKIFICDENGNYNIMGNGMVTKDDMAYRASVPKHVNLKLLLCRNS